MYNRLVLQRLKNALKTSCSKKPSSKLSVMDFSDCGNLYGLVAGRQDV